MINKLLKEYFWNEGYDLDFEMGTDFAYYDNKNLITYSLVVSERMDNLFMDFAKSKGLEVDCGIFFLSLLHEVGHYNTIDELTDRQNAKCDEAKRKLRTSDADAKKYFNILDERMATEWAINYINENAERLKKLSEKIEKIVDSMNIE